MPETHQLSLQPGLVVDQEFSDYALMQESARNWLYSSKYRFGKGTFYGRHSGAQLNDLQFGHALRGEGAMHMGWSPKDCLTIVILQKSSGKVCVDNFKMQISDVMITDDSEPYAFVSSDSTTLAIMSISKSLATEEFPWMLNTLNKRFRDKQNLLTDTLDREWNSILKNAEIFNDTSEIEAMQKRLILAMHSALEGQAGKISHLTAGEEMAIEVKSYLLSNIKEDMTIEKICRDFDISDKSLESSFKSLFGITPKHFIDLLKLNETHNDLCLADKCETTVTNIATKWGFTHFGRFSKNYKEHFGVNPSQTLSAL